MNTPPVEKLKVTMMWNRIDVGRKIFLEEGKWDVSVTNRFF